MVNFYKNKIIWIVGASSGIGKALALYLNTAGARVIISSRRMEEMEKMKASATNPKNLSILCLDLLEDSFFEEKVSNAFSIYGSIDYVFLNGGTSSRGSVNDTLIEVQRHLMNLNYFSYLALTKEILPYFLSQGKGHFVVTSSIMGKIGTPQRSAYAASKHALHGLYDCLRAELYSKNIKVTLLVPGHIATDISWNTIMADGKEKRQKSEIHEKGLPASKAAIQILKAVKRNKNEIYIGKKFNSEHLSLYAMRFFPGLLFKIVKNFVPK